MAEREIKELRKVYHKHKDVRVKAVESDLIELILKKKGLTLRLDLSAYPDGAFPFISQLTQQVSQYKKERTSSIGKKVLEQL
jgi:hypothetical protein